MLHGKAYDIACTIAYTIALAIYAVCVYGLLMDLHDVVLKLYGTVAELIRSLKNKKENP